MNEKALYRFIYELTKENPQGVYTELINEKKREVRKINRKTNPWIAVSSRVQKRVFDRVLTKEEKEAIAIEKTIPSNGGVRICTAWINFFVVEGKTICYHAIKLNV